MDSQVKAATLHDQIEALPTRAGVYLFRDADGEIVYRDGKFLPDVL